MLALLANSKRICKEHYPNPIRIILTYVIYLGASIGAICCCTVYSFIYGNYFSYTWLWTFLIGFGVDLIVYELLIWLIYLVAESTCIGKLIRSMKMLKTA